MPIPYPQDLKDLSNGLLCATSSFCPCVQLITNLILSRKDDHYFSLYECLKFIEYYSAKGIFCMFTFNFKVIRRFSVEDIWFTIARFIKVMIDGV